MKTLKHEEIGGGYSNKRKIIIDACEISSGEFSVMALYENGEELEEIETNTEVLSTDKKYQWEGTEIWNWSNIEICQ